MKKGLGKELFVDIMAGYILNEDIKVQKIALDQNVVVFRSGLTRIQRSDFPKNLNGSTKVGKFTPADDEVIELNWNNLIKETKIIEEAAIKELFEVEKKDKVLGLKMNVLGYYLAQGLPDIRLATEVIHRARIVLCARKGEFTAEENKIILQFVEAEGKKWSKLAVLLARTQAGVIKRRHETLTGDSKEVNVGYTVEEDKIVLTEVFSVNRSILKNGQIKIGQFKKIGAKLERPHFNVYQHWKQVLEPMLLRHHAGTLHVDVRTLLVDYLVEQNLNFSQDIEWRELSKLPQFAGTTPRLLQSLFNSLKSKTSNKFPEKSKGELTTESVERYMDRRDTSEATEKLTASNKDKREENQKQLINFYVTNIVGHKASK